MIKYVIQIFMCWIIFGCTTVIRIPSDRNGLEQAIRENNPDAAKAILKDKSFVGKSFDFFNENSRHENYYGRLDAYLLLELAITGRQGNNMGQLRNYGKVPGGVCRPGVVQAILDAGLSPRPIDLANACDVPCPEVVEIVMAKLSSEDITKGSQLFLKSMREQLVNRSDENKKKVVGWEKVIQILSKNGDSTMNGQIIEANGLLENVIKKPIRDSQEKTIRIREKYKINFCSNPDLFSTIYGPFGTPIEEKCLYILRGPVNVLQVIKGGILVSLIETNQNLPNKVFFIKTKKAYVDKDLVGSVLLKSNGSIKYTNTLGAENTIHAFVYLEDFI